VTAVAEPEQSHDFVSRLFAPKVGIPEDPVTGSSHTVLGPFWADRLGRTSLVGLQASSRPGRVGVEIVGDRTTITGRATTVLDGQLTAAAQPTWPSSA
jgi:predicted PhzF superfamily epimerase YddE/YHI9